VGEATGSVAPATGVSVGRGLVGDSLGDTSGTVVCVAVAGCWLGLQADPSDNIVIAANAKLSLWFFIFSLGF
jgi:hypothetical protein